MKQIKITTSKGDWIVSEIPNKIKELSEWWDLLPEVSLDNFRKRIQLSKITEKEASEIVESYEYPMSRDILGYEDYTDKGFNMKDTAIESLHSLLKSKGITELNNKYIFKI